MRPLVIVTGFQREIQTTLPGLSPQVTVHRRFGDLMKRAGGLPLIAEPAADVDELLGPADPVVGHGGGDARLRPGLLSQEPEGHRRLPQGPRRHARTRPGCGSS